MNVGLIDAVLLAWLVVVTALFRAIGPRRAVLVGIIGGFVLLPSANQMIGPPGSAIPFNRNVVTGLALLLGSLIFDHRTLLRSRPGWVDLPMIAFGLAPLIGLATGVPGSSADILDLMVARGLGLVVPYLMGRLYFGREGGPAELAVALTIAGLANIPICLYEEIAGPTRYLAGLIYGMPYSAIMVDRLGGWRPEGFIGDGLTLSAWMALTTVTATWLWLGGWRPGRWPAWSPALALLLAALSCRGIFGYLTLAIGLSATFLTRLTRSRAILAALIVLPILYMGLRLGGLWDAAILVKGATFTGREGTLVARLTAEDQFIGAVLQRSPVVGFGTYAWHSGLPCVQPDGNWVRTLWSGGLLGLGLEVMALGILPVFLTLGRTSGRPDGRQSAAPSWGLACWCILVTLDGLFNPFSLNPTALVVGALVGFSSWKGVESIGARPDSGRLDARRRPVPVPLIVSAIVLVAVEILGRWPRTPAPRPTAPPLEGPSAKGQP
jgi:hypothetical protein